MKNPFSKGNSCLNCFSTLCGPSPPSFLNPRAIITPDDGIGMSPAGIINSNTTEEILRYQPDRNGHHNNYVINLFIE